MEGNHVAIIQLLTSLDVTHIACVPGEDAFLFSAEHPVQEYAADLGTISYEALTSISPRVKRVFVHGG